MHHSAIGRHSVFVFLLLCIAASLPAAAGSFQVNPIRLDLSAKAATAALSVKNTGADAVVVQVSIEEWTQQDGKDVYAPTKDVLVTPPVVTIPAGAERILRAGLRRPADSAKELSYRLFLQEVPPPPQPGFQGLVVALRVGLPVFVQPTQAAAAPRVTWRARRVAPDRVEVTATNAGNAHIQVAELHLHAGGAAEPLGSHTGLSYVLPEQSRTWTLALKSPAAGTPLRLKSVTDAGNLEADIDLAN